MNKKANKREREREKRLIQDYDLFDERREKEEKNQKVRSLSKPK
jgi:hypothetical protein